MGSEVVRLLVCALEHLVTCRRHDDWVLPRGLAPMQVFPPKLCDSLETVSQTFGVKQDSCGTNEQMGWSREDDCYEWT